MADEGMCPVTHLSIEGGAACRYKAGHEEAGLPHTTVNGTWWHDEKSQARYDELLSKTTHA